MASLGLVVDQAMVLLVLVFSFSALALVRWLRPKHKGPFPPGPPPRRLWGNWDEIVKGPKAGGDPKWKSYCDWAPKYGTPAYRTSRLLGKLTSLSRKPDASRNVGPPCLYCELV